MGGGLAALEELRREIDSIDDAMHDLALRRAALAARVRAAKGTGGPIFQPGREARILRRLAARHSGTLPLATVAAIWRAMIGANARLQAELTIAVPAGPDWLLVEALRHFGFDAPMRRVRSPEAALAAMRAGRAQIAVVGLPARRAAWWAGCGRTPEAPIVAAAIPFVGAARACVLTPPPFSPSGDDRGLVAVEGAAGPAALRAARAAGLDPVAVRARAAGRPLVLIETAQYVTPGAAALADLAARLPPAGRVWVAGGFAVPVAA